jgi:hypothetical protein
MSVEEDRRKELLEKLRSPEQHNEVIAYLKSLKGIPPDAPLPNGTPIITEIIRLERAHGIQPHQKQPAVDARRQ